MLEDDFRDMVTESTFNHARKPTPLQIQTSERRKKKNILERELLLADDSALIADPAEDIQRIVDVFTTASSKFGLKINIKDRSDVQPYSTTASEEEINLDDSTLNNVQEFTYLCSIKVRDGHTEAELQKRL